VFGLQADKMHVVHNWVDTRQFTAKPRATNSLGVTTLVYVGWLSPGKGVEYLLKAIRMLLYERRQLRLNVYGGGVLEDSLKALAQELGIAQSVKFHGWVPNDKIPSILNQSDIFVFPTLREGMPNSLLQAMACGLPVVATNVTSIPEIVVNERNGYLVPPRSPEALAAAIARMLDEPELRSEIGRHNAAAVLSRHSVECAWRKVGEIIVPDLHFPGFQEHAENARLELTGCNIALSRASV
jgi:glycosyltransferase involved in cell wall biosynthesis